MNISTEHSRQSNQSEPLADASGRIVDLINENEHSKLDTALRISYVIVAS